MKRFKSGFSLAEVLLALAIVAIIATLGFTMSRKGIEHAYNQYIYTGYNSMSIAIAEVISNGHAYDPEGDFKQDFFDELRALLHSKDIAAANTQPVIANNFIKLPFMGMIAGASTGHWWDSNADPGIGDVGIEFMGDRELDTSLPDDTTISGPRSNGTLNGGTTGDPVDTSSGCSLHHIIGCSICYPNTNGDNEDPPYYGDQASCPECGGLGKTVETIRHKLGCSKGKPSEYDQQMEELNRGQDLNNGDTNADTTDYSIIKAKNGISYKFTKGSIEFANSDYGQRHVLKISMSVPSPKNKYDDAKGYSLLYIPDSEYPLLPIKSNQLDSNVVDKTDILAYTIDNGVTGRIVGEKYVPSKIYTAREAVCYNFGPTMIINDSLSFEEETGAAAVGQGFRPGFGLANMPQGNQSEWMSDYHTGLSNGQVYDKLDPTTAGNGTTGMGAGGGTGTVQCRYCHSDFNRDFSARDFHESQCPENPVIKNANKDNHTGGTVTIPDGDNDDDASDNSYDLFGCPEGIEPVQGALQLVGPRR